MTTLTCLSCGTYDKLTHTSFLKDAERTHECRIPIKIIIVNRNNKNDFCFDYQVRNIFEIQRSDRFYLLRLHFGRQSE